MNFRLSKSKYLKGLQCAKLLWWSLREPEANELIPDILREYRYLVGQKIGRIARGMFLGGILVEEGNDAFSWVSHTQEVLGTDVPAIFEAAFSTKHGFAAVDVLERTLNGFNLIEVKSAMSVKETYLEDLAYQTYIAELAGLRINRIEIMHVNREGRFPIGADFFTRVDVSNDVRNKLPQVESLVAQMLQQVSGDLPDVAIGPHCDSPYECEFKARCWPVLPEHHISTLYKTAAKLRAEYEASGVSEVSQLRDETKLSPIQIRQIKAVRQNELQFDPAFKKPLAELKFPIAYLDFETISSAIPLWPNTRPYQRVPVQFSCHIEFEDGRIEHHEWIATSPSEDPRMAMAHALLSACEPAATIVAYHAPVEKGCIEDVACMAPEIAGRLREQNKKFFDLLPLIRNHIYHPKFHGSFSIKAVLPALIPNVSYKELSIGEGMSASIWLERILTKDDLVTDKDRLLEDLKAYCKLDTWAMVLLMQCLRKL